MNKKFLAVTITLFVAFGLFFAGGVKAGPEHNISGWAWSENIGWISFNSANCNITPRPVGCPPAGTPISNYGVNIEANGNMTGFAWSANIGWIHFNETTGFPGLPHHSARVDLDGTTCGGIGQICGWVRALAHGNDWDGWIKMQCRGVECAVSNYGVWIDRAVNPHELRGWAWGSDVVGWISFNDKEPLPAGPVDYQVITTMGIGLPPINLLATTTPEILCRGCFYTFSWGFSDPGYRQHAYQVQIDREANFLSPIDVDSGKIFSTHPSFAAINPLLWNTTYHWRVRVWDSADVASGWSIIHSFTTPHRYPAPDFTWSPSSPTVNTIIQFTDAPVCYGANNAIVPCNAWAWDFNNDGIIDSTSRNPTTTYATAGNYTVTLRVTDGSGFSCSISKTINVAAPFPEWREIPPVIWWRRLLAVLPRVFRSFRLVINF